MITIHTEQSIAVAHCLSLSYASPCERVHGHNLRIIVEMSGHLSRGSLVEGMLIDFSEIKNIIREYDHQSLNEYLEQPTAENFAWLLHARFAALLSERYPKRAPLDLRLEVCVRIYESDASWVEVRG